MNEDRAARYHRRKRRAAVGAVFAGAAWLVLLAATGWGTTVPAAIYIAILALGWELVSFPFTFYRHFLLERKYGLASEPSRTWLIDHLKAVALVVVLSEIAGLAIHTAIRAAGGLWWLTAAGLFALSGLLLTYIAPVLLLPMFYRFRPLGREALRDRLLALSNRAGVPVLGAFEWGLGAKTTRANAALVGAGRTRRILVSDTLLEHYSDDEIEVVLAHEIGHHVHHDVATGLALETGVVAVALLTAHLVVTTTGHAPSDLSSLPLLVLAAAAVSLVLTPLGNAWSRHNERRADRFALALTGRPDAFISAMRRLAAQNLAEPHPSRGVLWFFHTHPAFDERIAAARQ